MAFLFDGGSNLQCYTLFLIIESIMVVLIDLGGMIKCVIKYSFYCVCMYVYLKWMTLSIFFFTFILQPKCGFVIVILILTLSTD